jgi:hypothetical protein
MRRGENLIKEVAKDVGCIIINDNEIVDDSNECWTAAKAINVRK